jgi:hypothetical protein
MNKIKFNNILTDKDYITTHELPNNLKLSTSIISYFVGNDWKCISLITMLKHLVLHDKYIDTENNNKEHDISLIICPISLVSCVVDGKFYPTKFKNNFLICENEYKEEFDFFVSTKFKKREVDIKKLKNAFIDHPDIKFVVNNNKSSKLLFTKKYYKNLLDYNTNKLS